MKHDYNKLVLIIDSSVIIELINLDMLDKLAMYKEITKAKMVIPKTVRDELSCTCNNLKITQTLRILTEKMPFEVMKPPRDKIEEIGFIYPSLGKGEKGVLALALKFKTESSKTVIALLDDKRARNACKELGLNFHGTLWILVQLKKHGIIGKDLAVNSISKLPTHGFYISEETLRKVMARVKKDC